MPAILARDSFTLIEPAVARLLAKYDLSFEDLFAGHQEVRTKIEQSALPKALAKKFATDEKALHKLLAAYSDPLHKLDKTLARRSQSRRKENALPILQAQRQSRPRRKFPHRRS